MTIVATAQPQIVSHFNALEKLAWISSAYFLTNAGLILTVGQILTIAPKKWVFIVSILLFELGSLFSAVAPSMDFLIFGRAVAGCGGAGIFTACLAIFAEITRLEERAFFLGFFSALFAVSNAVGPLLGGAFSDHVSWRWCFYINLPFGALTILCVALFLPPGDRGHTEEIKNMSFGRRFLRVDHVGTILSLGFTICLLLALQWGGNTKPWNSKDVIISLAVAGALLVLFFIWEWFRGEENAMLPLSFLRRRTQVGASIESFFLYLCFQVGTYYIPLWYQAKGSTASQSGVHLLPFTISVVAVTVLSSSILRKTGRYWPLLFISPMISAVGAGLLFTIIPSSSAGRVIGYQIIFGAGIGGAFQVVIIAVQAEYATREHLIPQGNAILNYLQILGGVIGVTVGGCELNLSPSLQRLAPGLSVDQFNAVRSSVTVISTLPPELREGVIRAYSDSLDGVFLIGVACSGLAMLCSLIVKDHNIKECSQSCVANRANANLGA